MTKYARCFAVFAVALIPCSPLGAQANSTARISGRAISAYNGRPLAGVMISVLAGQKLVVTDSMGAFSLTDLPAGQQAVRVSYLGRQTQEYAFALRNGRTMKLAVVLDATAADLGAIVVEARSADGWRDLAGFYERRKRYSGYARFYTREDIERERPGAISALLNGAGIFSWCASECLPTRASGNQICTVPVNVDGLPLWAHDFDRIPIADVAAVEIYRDQPYRDRTHSSPFGTPRVGQTSTEAADIVQGRGSCGSVVIWTR